MYISGADKSSNKNCLKLFDDGQRTTTWGRRDRSGGDALSGRTTLAARDRRRRRLFSLGRLFAVTAAERGAIAGRVKCHGPGTERRSLLGRRGFAAAHPRGKGRVRAGVIGLPECWQCGSASAGEL